LIYIHLDLNNILDVKHETAFEERSCIVMLPVLNAIESEEDKIKISELFTEYYNLMLYISKGILKDHALAEDAVSDSFVKIFRNIHKIEEIKCHKTRALIVVIVRNSAIDIYNKMNKNSTIYDKAVLAIPSISPSVVDEIISIEGYSNMVDIFNSLPESLKVVAKLAFIHKYEYKEISELLGITYDTVRKRISRAKNAIKNALND